MNEQVELRFGVLEFLLCRKCILLRAAPSEGRILDMKRIAFFSTALMLVISLIVVSCAPAEVQTEDTSNTIQVYFGNLKAKAIDDTAYSVTGSATFDGSTVKIGDVDDYYWSYKATKNDSLFTEGQTNGFVNCAEGTGLGTARTFSKGKWLFELRAYATADDRTAGTQYLFSGTNESIASNNSDTVLSSNTTISIPVEYSYIAGTGIADFAITTTLTQDKEEAGSAITDYTVTGVTASIGGKDYTLTSSDSTTSATRTWKLTTPQEVASGVQAVGLKVFVDSAEVSQASNTSVGNAIILHGLTTEIKGTATITLTGSTIGLTFNSSLPSEQPTESDFPLKLNVSVGDTLLMGKVPTSDTTYGGQDITWKVLSVDEENDRALVISKRVLTNMKLENSLGTNVYGKWVGSTIYTWLNNSGSDGFISQYGLSNVSMESVEHTTTHTSTTTETSDEKVFIFSKSEIEEYLTDIMDRVGWDLSSSPSCWWIRDSSDNDPEYVTNYDTQYLSNGIYSYQYTSFPEYGVRPAFWIKLSNQSEDVKVVTGGTAYTISITSSYPEIFHTITYVRGSTYDEEVLLYPYAMKANTSFKYDYPNYNYTDYITGISSDDYTCASGRLIIKKTAVGNITLIITGGGGPS
jgi:hypothetical protein